MILVTGATGNVGGAVLRRLAAEGRAVRTLIRSPDQAQRLPAGVETVIGGFEDRQALARAFEGVDVTFMTAFSHPDFLALQDNIIAAARNVGVRVIARISGMGADENAAPGYSRDHGVADRRLACSGLGYLLLRPNWFHQNFHSMAAGGAIRLPVGDGRVSFVDVRDIAAVAIAALDDQGLWNQAFTLTGPETLSHAEVADIISDATGRRVVFEDLSEDAWAAESGMDAGAAADLNGLFRDIRAGRMAPVADDVERVTGRPAIAFADYARDHAEELARAVVGEG